MQLAVVVPTRNRADIAPAAVRSALDDPRVRVVVSDNSTDPEQLERLRAACEALADERVRYLRPPEGLPMTPHWQWALDRALEDPATTHVLYLSDRRALRPGAVAEALAIAERHPATVLTFGDDVLINDEETPVRVVERRWTGRLLRVDAAHMLRISARGMSHVALPRMLNGITPRTVLDDITQAYGNVFDSIAPDHCFGYRCLDRVDSILHLDKVLVVQRAMGRSNGYSQMRGIVSPDNADFMRELRDLKINQYTPVPELLTVTNAGFNEYEYVRGERVSRKLPAPPRHFYLGANARDVALLQDPALRERMEGVLREHGWTPRMRARYTLALAASAAGYYGRHVEALVARLRSAPPTVVEFGDAELALAYALEHPGEPSAEADHLWPLLSRPGSAHRVPGYGPTAGPAAPASAPRTGRPSRESTPAGP
ncbi:glycosyltransferase [Solirubrobacter soli]|uniref:glycosyltransferase n=1 Tax=Solirubrobacter soli TaxID=363832 RepID=UPI000480C775|nr:glycosyltransferase [Solirubrobacter soli]